jgi:mono/diheme cytochrome c family protein
MHTGVDRWLMLAGMAAAIGASLTPARSSPRADTLRVEIPATVQDTGARLFAVNCAPCHQLTGLGLGDTIPPLAGSEWVTGSESRLLRVILGGLTGEIEVQGEMFKGAMPGWGPLLDDNQVAAIASYIRRSWGNKAAPVTAAAVAQLRRGSADRKTPWTAEELRKIGGTR